MSKKLLALLLALVMIVGSFTSVLAENVTETKKEPVATEKEKKDEKSEEKKDEKSEEKKEEKTEEKTEEKKEEKKEEPVKTNDEALDRAIEVLKKAGFISGFSKDSDDFRTEQNVTRAQFASMIVRAKGLEASAKALATVPTGFKDVPANGWANGYIAVAKQQGFVNGYPNGTFRPDAQVSYQDMATMLTIALGKAEAGTVYPAGYIVKAQQLGLFKNVDVPAYTDMATRGNVFKMLYNMITSKEFGERKILKAIVLENSRLEKIADDEVVVEVIKVVQQANWVGANRDKRGDQHKYKLDKDLKLDAEDMLGKVYDITVDKDDKIVEVKLDNSYDYLDGNITTVDPKKFGVNWVKYTAELDERYDDTDERIYRTYLNNKDYTYADFAAKYRKEWTKADYYYTRVTVKNSKVVFIDAYKFKDIAPVESVKDGSVWYYDDERDATVVRANRLESVVFNTAKGYSVGTLKEIVKDDVIHLYEDYRDYKNTHAIVKKDARIDTELTKTSLLENGKEYAVNKDGKYRFNDVIPFRPVYSYEGKRFEVVTSRELLQPIVGRKVKMLVAIDGTLQLIESDLQWNDGVNAIRRITSSGDVLLVPSKGDTFWAKEDRNTKYYSWLKKDNNKQLSQLFGLNDIVYFEGAGSEKDQAIARMARILEHIPATYEVVTKKITDNDGKTRVIKETKEKTPNMFKGYKYYANSKDFFKETFNFVDAEINSRYISLFDKQIRAARTPEEKFRYYDNLHAYYLDSHDNLRQINNIERFIKDNDGNEGLKAVVYTENDLKLLLENYFGVRTYHFLSHSDRIANIVVFDGAYNTADSDVVFAEVIGKDNWTSTVLFRDANGKEFAVNLKDEFDEGKEHDKYGNGDIVKLHILKASADKDVKEGFVEKVAIYADADRLPITEIRDKKVYKIGNDENKFFDKDTVIFDRLAGYYAQVYYEDQDVKDGDPDVVRVIRFFEEGNPGKEDKTVYNVVNSEKTNYPALALMNAVSHKVKPYFVNPDTNYFDDNNSWIGQGKDGLAGLKAAYDEAIVELTVRAGDITEVRVKQTREDRIKAGANAWRDKIVKAIKDLGEVELKESEVSSAQDAQTAFAGKLTLPSKEDIEAELPMGVTLSEAITYTADADLTLNKRHNIASEVVVEAKKGSVSEYKTKAADGKGSNMYFALKEDLVNEEIAKEITKAVKEAVKGNYDHRVKFNGNTPDQAAVLALVKSLAPKTVTITVGEITKTVKVTEADITIDAPAPVAGETYTITIMYKTKPAAAAATNQVNIELSAKDA